MPNCVLIDRVDELDNGSWHKVKKDVTQICNEIGFQSIIWHDQNHNVLWRIPDALQGIKRIKRTVGKEDCILLQYPHHPLVVNLTVSAISRLKKSQNCRLIILIHDVCFLRGTKYALSRIHDMKRFEVDIFNQADVIIVHNEAMKKALLEAGVRKPIVCLEVFDYCCDKEKTRGKKEISRTTVVYAGDLATDKSGFIYQCPELQGIDLNLYGKSHGELKPWIHYKGSVHPDELVDQMEGHYGLVWNGASADSCTGNYGEYLKFNCPHKLSLYIAAGLPVIVWKESAMAKYVEENGIGIAVSSLRELANLPKADSTEYERMVQSLSVVQDKLRSGEMLKNAVSKAIRELGGIEEK